jgi:hypothetical protein
MRRDDAKLADPWNFARPELTVASYPQPAASSRADVWAKNQSPLRDLMPAAAERGYLAAYTNLCDSQLRIPADRDQSFRIIVTTDSGIVTGRSGDRDQAAGEGSHR